MTFVRNVPGTSDDRAPGGDSWDAYARSETGSRRQTCVVNGCSRDAVVGAHVMPVDPFSDGGANGEPGIALMCHRHNHHSNTAVMSIDSRAKLAPLPRQSSLDALLMGSFGASAVAEVSPHAWYDSLPPDLRAAMITSGIHAAQEPDRGSRPSGAGIALLGVGLGLLGLGTGLYFGLSGR